MVPVTVSCSHNSLRTLSVTYTFSCAQNSRKSSGLRMSCLKLFKTKHTDYCLQTVV